MGQCQKRGEGKGSATEARVRKGKQEKIGKINGPSPEKGNKKKKR